MIIDGVEFKKAIDSNGRIIYYSERGASSEDKAYEDCPFITLPKEDANRIFQYLNYVVIKNENQDDTTAFNDSGIEDVGLSFERLVDRLDGLNYYHRATISTDTEIIG